MSRPRSLVKNPSGACKYEGGRYYVWGTCPQCGLTRWVRVQNKGEQATKSEFFCLHCGVSRARLSIPLQPKSFISRGYKCVRILSGNPYFSMGVNRSRHSNRFSYVREQRLIMAQELGRNLSREEHVHHLNGNKLDNRPTNLCLTSNKDHDKRSFIKQLQARIVELERRLSGNT